MKKSVLLLLMLLSFISQAQKLRLPASEDIPDIQLVSSVSYGERDLPGYSGTNAGIIREYGFRSLEVFDYTLQNQHIRLEVLTMEDAPSAFGIYSVSAGHCLLWNRYSTFSCTTPNQVSAAFGPYCITVKDAGKTGSARPLCDQVAEFIIKNNQQDQWYMPPLFQSPKLARYVNTLRYIEGPDALTAVTPQLIEPLGDLQYKCFTLDITDRGQVGILARIQFPDFNSQGQFLTNAGLNNDQQSGPVQSLNGLYRSFYKIDDTKLIYLECSTPNLRLSDIIPDKPELYGGW